MKQEIIKLFNKKRGWLLLLLFCLAKCIMVIYQGYDSHYIIDQDLKGYNYYIKKYSGKLTETQEQRILEEYDLLNKADAKISELYDQMQEKKITKDDYQNQCKQYLEASERKFIFQVMYSKYAYAKKDIEQHYIMDSRGWETLLTHGNLDFLLVLAILILIAPIFNYEYESKMDVIINTCKNGKVKSAVWKLLLAMLLAAIVTVVFQLISFIYLAFTVGLPHGDYPIQSLTFFEKSDLNKSIYEVYIAVFLLKIFGSVMMAIMVSFIAVYCKRSILTLVLGSCVVLLPALVFQNHSIRYYLPFPTGLMSTNGYIWPDKYEMTRNDLGKLYRLYEFHRIETTRFVCILCSLLVESAALFWLSVRKFSYDKWMKYSCSKSRMKGVSCILVFLLLIAGCSGCSKEQKEDSFVFCEEIQWEQGQYKNAVIRLNMDSDSSIMLIEDGQEEELIREVFPDEFSIQSICIRDKYCYYLVKSIDKMQIRIYQLNLENRNLVIMYNSVPENQEDFFGMKNEDESLYESYENMEYVESFFVVQDDIFIRVGAKLEKIDLTTKTVEVLFNDMGNERYCYMNGCIYYVATSHRLNCYDINSGKCYSFQDVFTDYIKIENDQLLYTDILDNNQIKSLNIQDTKCLK